MGSFIHHWLLLLWMILLFLKWDWSSNLGLLISSGLQSNGVYVVDRLWNWGTLKRCRIIHCNISTKTYQCSSWASSNRKSSSQRHPPKRCSMSLATSQLCLERQLFHYLILINQQCTLVFCLPVYQKLKSVLSIFYLISQKFIWCYCTIYSATMGFAVWS